MSKRNFILLIIILALAIIAVFIFLYFQQPADNKIGDDTPGTNFFSQFDPFRTKPKPPAVTPPVDVSGYQPAPTVEAPKMKLTKVSSMPIAGFAVFSKERLKEVPIVTPVDPTTETPTKPASTTTTTKKPTKPTPPPTEFALALRYVEKATGNIYQTFVDKLEERKFSTTIIPKVYDAYWGNKGGSVAMRYLKTDDKTIETFVSTLPKEVLGGDTTGGNEIKGVFLPDNVKDISISPDTLKMFYLFENQNNMIGTILNFTNNKKVQIFDSPFTEWLSAWPSNNVITLSTKPSARIPGYVYTMGSDGKNLINILGDISGLTTLGGPNGKLILYGNSNLALSIYRTDTRAVDTLGLKTLPEKCAWNKTSETIYCAVPKSITTGEYPDAWYQGEVSFDDQLWKIDVKTKNATLLLDPSTITSGEEIDGVKLALDEGENFLFFVNKKDNFLWKLDLK